MKAKNIEIGEGSMFFIPNSDAEDEYSDDDVKLSIVNTPKNQKIAAEKHAQEEKALKATEMETPVIVEKLSEFDEAVRVESKKRNRYPQKLNMQLHPSWTLRIRSQMREKILLTEGYKGTHVKLSIGGTMIVPEVITTEGKAPIKAKKLDPKSQKKQKKIEKRHLMKNLSSFEFTGNRIKFN
jgi:ABC-type uncharacterized transport system involved in gliding motility auxiliary subunit